MTLYTRIAAFVLLLLALVLGGYAWLLGRKPPPKAPPASAATAPAAAPVPQYAVAVAAKPIAAGQPIGKDDVRLVQLPIRPAGAFDTAEAAVDRVPVLDIGENTPLTEGQLVSGLSLRLEAGERAVAVKADEVMGVGNKLRPGDFVDVFFVLKGDGKDVERSQSRLLLPRLRVLAYGSASVDGAPPARAGSGGRAESQPQRAEAARTAVLAVPVDLVNRLVLGDASARLLLALRRPDDTELPDASLFATLPPAIAPVARRGAAEAVRAPLQGLDLAQAGLATADLAAGGAAPRQRPAARAAAAPRPAGPARPPAGNEVELIRGGQREMVRY